MINPKTKPKKNMNPSPWNLEPPKFPIPEKFSFNTNNFESKIKQRQRVLKGDKLIPKYRFK